MQRAAENINMLFDSHMIHERKCPSIDFNPKQQRIKKIVIKKHTRGADVRVVSAIGSLQSKL